MNSDPSTTTKYLLGTEDVGESNPVLYNLHIIEGYDLAGAIREYSELYNLDDHYEKPVLIRKVEQWRTVGPISGFGVRARPDKTKPEQDESREEATMKEETEQRDDIMITFKEFDEAIANVAIDAVFPKRDLYKKPVYLHDNKDKKIGMTYVIMPFGSKKYNIGFIQEQGSFQFTVWNGKMDHIVFDVDERDGCIRYYHEPELYDRDNGLSHSQIQTIGETLIKYLTSNKEEKDDNESEETKQRDDIMTTYDQLSKIFREQLKILFPGKHISSNESKSENMEVYEMQFHIVVDPGKPHLIIGFTKEKDSSMIDIWNGKRMNKVIDIDIDDGYIRRYHEPQLYDAESNNCLRYSQISAIYTALDTFLDCEDAADERCVKYDPETVSLEQIQSAIERWMISNDIRGNACESDAEKFYYDLYDGKSINGSVITTGEEKEILIWMNADTTPVMRITPSVVSLKQTHVPSFTDKEVYDLYNEISEAVVLLEEKDTKKHPLQNSPTFPEEESVEEKHYAIIDDTTAVVTEDKTWMEHEEESVEERKSLDVVEYTARFDIASGIELCMPYILEITNPDGSFERRVIVITTISAQCINYTYWEGSGVRLKRDTLLPSSFCGDDACKLYKITGEDLL